MGGEAKYAVHRFTGPLVSKHEDSEDARRALVERDMCVVKDGVVLRWANGSSKGDQRDAIVMLRKCGVLLASTLAPEEPRRKWERGPSPAATTSNNELMARLGGSQESPSPATGGASPVAGAGPAADPATQHQGVTLGGARERKTSTHATGGRGSSAPPRLLAPPGSTTTATAAASQNDIPVSAGGVAHAVPGYGRGGLDATTATPPEEDTMPKLKKAAAKQAAARKLNTLVSKGPRCTYGDGCVETSEPDRPGADSRLSGLCTLHRTRTYARLWAANRKAKENGQNAVVTAPVAPAPATPAVRAYASATPTVGLPDGFDVVEYITRCFRAVQRLGGPENAEKMAVMVEEATAVLESKRPGAEARN